MAKALRKSRNETLAGDTEPAKVQLLRAAKRQFARRGLSGTSIRDIAREANMNSSQISYYFSGKEGLYRACIEDIAQPLVQLAGQVLVPPRSKEDFQVRLRLFVESFINHFLEDQAAGLIMIREYDRPHSPAEDVFKSRFIELLDTLRAFFEKAVKKGFIPKNRDSFAMTSLLFGTLMGELRFDHIKDDIYHRSIRHEKEKQLIVDHIVDLFSLA